LVPVSSAIRPPKDCRAEICTLPSPTFENARPSPNTGGLVTAVERLWGWLAAAQHQQLLKLWAESYACSLVEPDGVWGGFAAATVHDWLTVLSAYQPPRERDSAEGAARRTLALAVLRGALLDLLATADHDRVTAAVHLQLALLQRGHTTAP